MPDGDSTRHSDANIAQLAKLDHQLQDALVGTALKRGAYCRVFVELPIDDGTIQAVKLMVVPRQKGAG